MTEAGFWTLNDREAAGFAAYLRKGGFVIFDDFRDDQFRGGGGWQQFESNMRRVIPDAQFVDLDPSHPIFHCFFEIDSFDIIPQDYHRARPILRGLYQDNDPKKRLMAIVNFNTDVSNFWEFSGTGFRPVVGIERGLQARDQLRDVRPDPLSQFSLPAAPAVAIMRGCGFSAAGDQTIAVRRAPRRARRREESPNSDRAVRRVTPGQGNLKE